MPWTVKQKVFCVSAYLRTKSFKLVRISFTKEFNCKSSPPKSRVQSWTKKFLEHGTLLNLNSKKAGVDKNTHSGRPLTVRDQRTIEKVNDSVRENPKKSIRRRSQELGVKKSSLQKILTTDLKLTAYHIQIHQSLSPGDVVRRVDMCRWFKERLEENPAFLRNVWFSDEAHFLLSGHVNSKNNIYWGSTPPTEVVEKPLHSLKCTAWVAMSEQGLVGPFWFEDEHGREKTVDSEGYIDVLTKFWTTLGQRRIQRGTQWLQQDGATPHCSNVTLAWIETRFQDRVISRRCHADWAPHSPDLNPLDFHLWGFLKDKVYEKNPKTISDLKIAIQEKIQSIPREQCERVIANFKRRIDVCIQRGGRHLEHVL